VPASDSCLLHMGQMRLSIVDSPWGTAGVALASGNRIDTLHQDRAATCQLSKFHHWNHQTGIVSGFFPAAAANIFDKELLSQLWTLNSISTS